ncbi:hypothetical protein [Algibacter sp. 2305UL17-15]|uniref:hypothetical protein n=1 Tax=Algibacter sp. 2305UL17-15 TaxID=3231268 RepID=UPI003458D97D
MLDQLKKILILSSGYYAINIFKTDGVFGYQLIEFLYKNDELLIKNRFFANKLDEAFKEKLKKDYPVLLHIEGNAIINKAVENKTGYRNDLIFKADLNEFYFYEYHQNETIFISVSRKEHIDACLEQISNLGLFVIHISFGPFVMANLLPIAKDYSALSSSNYTLDISNNEVVSFQNTETTNTEYVINDDKFNQRELPLLATFLEYKYPNPKIDFDADFLVKNSDEFKYKKWFKIAGIFMLVFFLVSLTVSHFFMDYYANALAEKQSMYAMSQQTTAKVLALKEEKILKEKILQSSGIGNSSFLTQYVMDIGNSVPSDIILNTIHIVPLFKKIKPAEKIDFEMSIITILGESENDTSFNNWLKVLGNLAWIKKMDIEDYSEETNTENTFKIKIKI